MLDQGITWKIQFLFSGQYNVKTFEVSIIQNKKQQLLNSKIMISCVPKQFLGVRDVSELTCSRNLERYSAVTGARRTGVGDSSNASHQFRCAPKRFIPPIFNSQWYTSCEFSSIKSRMNKTSSSGVCSESTCRGIIFIPLGNRHHFLLSLLIILTLYVPLLWFLLHLRFLKNW